MFFASVSSPGNNNNAPSKNFQNKLISELSAQKSVGTLSTQKKFIHIEFYFIFHRDSSLDYSKHLLFLYQKHIYFLYIQKFLRQSRNLGLKKRASYLISESIWQNHRVDSHMERLPLRTCNRLNLRLLTCLFPLLKKKSSKRTITLPVSKTRPEINECSINGF